MADKQDGERKERIWDAGYQGGGPGGGGMGGENGRILACVGQVGVILGSG
jgi:hypothetical protein